MKSIKRIITTIAVLFITTSIFAQIAQTSDYEIHLQKGKEYENQKKWIYALGEYYDALDSIFADIKNEDIIYSNKYQNKENKEYTVYIYLIIIHLKNIKFQMFRKHAILIKTLQKKLKMEILDTENLMILLC